MPTHDLDNDDYVANLLKQDAKKSSKRYEMVGLDAFNPPRPRNTALKPNTRFLKHIIRETDSHNAALLAKEAEDSRARLRSLYKEEPPRTVEPGRLTPPTYDRSATTSRRHKRSDSEDELFHRSKRRRSARSRDRSEDRYRSREKDDRGRDSSQDRYDREDRSRRKDRHKHHRHEGTRSRHECREEGRHRDNRHRRRDDKHDDRLRRREKTKVKRSRTSNSLSKSPSPARGTHGHRKRSSKDRAPATFTSRASRQSSRHEESDSDPLEAIVGPLPPAAQPSVRMRGRGAHKVNTTAMDARFSTTYDPSADVHVASDMDDDWGDALEALKDRQRWKQQGAERLKAAGFTDHQVEKWERGEEKNEDDVQWTKKGEDREWDRGKVVDQDGDVAQRAAWGRLT